MDVNWFNLSQLSPNASSRHGPRPLRDTERKVIRTQLSTELLSSSHFPFPFIPFLSLPLRRLE